MSRRKKGKLSAAVFLANKERKEAEMALSKSAQECRQAQETHRLLDSYCSDYTARHHQKLSQTETAHFLKHNKSFIDNLYKIKTDQNHAVEMAELAKLEKLSLWHQSRNKQKVFQKVHQIKIHKTNQEIKARENQRIDELCTLKFVSDEK